MKGLSWFQGIALIGSALIGIICLIDLIVDSAAWSARVRYAGPRLREQLRAAGEPVSGKVRVRVGRSG